MCREHAVDVGEHLKPSSFRRLSSSISDFPDREIANLARPPPLTSWVIVMAVPSGPDAGIAKALGVSPATVDRDVASKEARGSKKTSENKPGKGGGATNEARKERSGTEAAAAVVERAEIDRVAKREEGLMTKAT
jgi:hypothetical protein